MARGKAISSGDRTELVTFERMARVDDGQGGAVETWAAIGQAWAAIDWVSGTEKADRKGALRSVSRYKLQMLEAAQAEMALTSADRVIWNGDALAIVEPPRDGLVIIEYIGGVV